jgi:hypothetical protein
VQIRRRDYAGEIRERWVEIDELDDALRRLPVRAHTRGRDDKWGSSGAFEQHLLHPLAALAEKIAVIADKDHNRVLAQPQPIERVEDPSDVGIEEADRRVICLDCPSHAILADIPVWRRRKPGGRRHVCDVFR